jgi:hypothetical protein
VLQLPVTAQERDSNRQAEEATLLEPHPEIA